MSISIVPGYTWASGGTVTPGRLNTALTGAAINQATARLLGRTTAGTGATEELSASAVKTFLGIAQADVSGLTTADSPGFTRLKIGAVASLTSDPAVIVQRAISGGSSNAHGFEDYSDFNQGTDLAYASFFANPTLSGARDYSHVRGFQSYPTTNVTGDIDEVCGFISWPTITNGDVAQVFGFCVVGASIAGGASVVDQYGLYVSPIVGATNNYAIVTGGAGLVRIGDTTESSAADNGSATFAGGVGIAKALRVAGPIFTTRINESFAATGVTTSARSLHLGNTTGDFYIGVESSAGGGFFGGSTAYACVLYSTIANPIQAIVNGVKIVEIATTGLAVTGVLGSSGAFGCNGSTPQTKAVSGGTLAGVIAALVANGILSS